MSEISRTVEELFKESDKILIAVERNDLEAFPVPSGTNKCYIRVSRTKCSRTTLFLKKYLTHRDRKISIFPNIFKFSRNISFERWSSAYIWPSASIYVVISDINRTVEELFKKIYKILPESRLKESIWRFFVSLLDQINVMLVFLARNTVAPRHWAT